MHFGSFLF